MYSAKQVDQMLAEWREQGLSKAQIVANNAVSCLGWPYVFGSWGYEDTVAKRRQYYNGSNIGAGDKKLIMDHCPVMNGKSSSCVGCRYFPGGERVLMFDCRGFTYRMLANVGIKLSGQGATSQWGTDANWEEKGLIKDMPADRVCCVFRMVGKTMEHTGLHIGGGRIIHCSVEVKEGTTKEFTHYAIPKGLGGEVEPMPAPVPKPSFDKPILRKGARGEYVTLLQTKLLMLGYDLGSYGADGSFGASTEKAVKKFQKDRGLDADGVVGKATWAELDKGVEAEKLYTATIPHLHESDVDALLKKYGDGGMTVTEE